MITDKSEGQLWLTYTSVDRAQPFPLRFCSFGLDAENDARRLTTAARKKF